MNKLKVYTDGGCRGNGKKSNSIGGYAYVIIKNKDEIVCTQSNAKLDTTNNIMELQAVISALQKVTTSGNYDVEVYSDSRYVVNCINQRWYKRWIINGWKTSKGELVKNIDLWKELLSLIKLLNSVKFVWVKGHNGNRFNEMCDSMLNQSMDNLNLIS